MKNIFLITFLLIFPTLVFAQCKDGDTTIQAVPDSTKVQILQTTAITLDLVPLRESIKSLDATIERTQSKRDDLCKQYQNSVNAGGQDSEQFDCVQ